MAREVHKFAVTVPARTAIAAPQLTELTMPPRVVTTIEVRIPPGPRGEVGFALAAAGVPMLPYQPGAWFVGDDEDLSWPVEGQISSGAWECRIYNTGQFPHTIEVRFLCDLPQEASPIAPSLIPATALSSLG